MTKDEAEVIQKIVDLIQTILTRLDKNDERVKELYENDSKMLKLLEKML